MIGGEHYFVPPHAVENSMGDMLDGQIGEVSFFSTGRDALFSQLTALPQKRIYLPDLICRSIYVACRAAGKQVISYKIGANLLHSGSPVSQRDPDSCFFVMHYFGIANNDLAVQARVWGMTVISDVTHMLFNDKQLHSISKVSDYLVASLRKSGPFPDGGFISSRFHPIVRATRPIREDFHALRTAGLFSRGFSAENDFTDDENFRLLRKAEDLIDQSPLGGHHCSYLARELLRTINVETAATTISRNIAVLASSLNGACETINTLVSPSPYFVCLFKNREKRDLVRKQLASHRVFCPVHWDTSQMPESSPLSELSLSVPCDTRYNEVDMQSVAEIIISCQ
jgi:hypothetical protein